MKIESLTRTERYALPPAGPTLDEIRGWPVTVDVAAAAAALGVSKSHAYECIRTNTFPARTITVSGRIRVLSASILAVLEGAEGVA
jgi:predicted DNA-binding transcriptional regulator AlpA